MTYKYFTTQEETPEYDESYEFVAVLEIEKKYVRWVFRRKEENEN